VRSANLFQLLKATGPQMDHSSGVRFLSEIVWLPSAFLRKDFTWTAIDDTSAEVSFTAFGRSVSGGLCFAADGRPTNFVSRRYKDDRDSEPLLWPGPATGQRTTTMVTTMFTACLLVSVLNMLRADYYRNVTFGPVHDARTDEIRFPSPAPRFLYAVTCLALTCPGDYPASYRLLFRLAH